MNDTPLLIALTSLAGGVGAALRLVLDGRINSRARFVLPLGTLTINISGSLILGILTGLATSSHIPTAVATVAGTGLMGGYTTFSTASFETVRLVRSGRLILGSLNGLGMLIVCVAASGLGLWLGTTL